jgi:uncharacterized protein
MYKLSKFNVVTSLGQGMYAMYNTNTCALAKLSSQQRETIYNSRELLQYGRAQDPQLLQALLDNGFVVKDELDEDQYIVNTERYMSSPDRLSLIILPTDNCNFRCVYCYENHKNNRMSADSWDAIYAFVTNKTQLKQLNISWFGGEPLLQASSIVQFGSRLMQYCRDNGIVFGQSMTTNGYLLTRERTQELLKHNLTKYQITIDGIQSEHDAKRYLVDKRGTWNVIVDNLRAIQDINQEYNIVIRYNYDNGSDIDQFLKIYKQLFGGDDRFGLQISPVCDWSTTGQEGGTQVNLNMIEVLSKAKSQGLRLHHTEFFRNSLSMVCYANWETSLVIMPDLSVVKCTVKLDADYNKIGRITNDGKFEFDQSKLDLWTKGRKRQVCQNCAVKPMCLSRYCPHRQQEDSDVECKHQINLLKSISDNNILKLGTSC